MSIEELSAALRWLNAMLTVVNAYLLYKLWSHYTIMRRAIILTVIFICATSFFNGVMR